MEKLPTDKLLMVIAMEELGEVITECLVLQKRLSKAIRFELDEVQDGQLLDNQERIVHEYNDLVAVMRVMESLSIIPNMNRPELQLEKIKRIYYQMNMKTYMDPAYGQQN